MITHHITQSWHSRPETWMDWLTEFHSTGASQTARSAGGSPAGSTVRGSTIDRTYRESVTTQSSSASTASNGSTSGGTSTGGVTIVSGRTTNADTSSAYNSAHNTDTFTGSSSFTHQVTITNTASFTEGLDVFKTSTSTSTASVTVTWPSTTDTTLTSGTEPATTTYTTWTFVTAGIKETTSVLTYTPIPTTGDEYSSTDTTTASVSTNTTAFHVFLPLPDTLVLPNAGGAISNLSNDALVWWPPGALTTASSIGLFTQFHSTLASGTNSAVATHYTWITEQTFSWLTHSLSTATSTSSSTTQGTGTNSTATGTESMTIAVSSLNGIPWETTGTGSSSAVWVGPSTGESTSTWTVGTDTFSQVMLTFTRQTTGYDTDNNLSFFTSEFTESFGNIYSFEVTWESWHRSFTTSGVFEYPTSTSTAFLFSSWVSTWFAGYVSSTSQEWQTLTRSTTWTDWDERTNAILIGLFSTVGQTTGGGGNTTATTAAESLGGVYERTDYSERRMAPFITPQSAHEFTRYNRAWQRVMPKGFLGFGWGFGEGASIYAGLSSSVLSGTGDSALSLGTNMPKAGYKPDASVFITNRCWLSGHPLSSHLSLSWLGTETSGRTSASLRHMWSSTTSTISGTDTTSTGTTFTATIGVYVSSPITGDFISEYVPWLNTSQSGIGWPIGPALQVGSGGGPLVGIAPITAAQTVTFSPGAMTWTQGTGSDTSSFSTSTSTGELRITFGSTAGAIALSYEEALKLSWSAGTFAQIESASVHYLPPWPWELDLQ